MTAVEELSVCRGSGPVELVKCNVRQECLWLWLGNKSGNQEGERPPLDAGTRSIVKGEQTERTQYVCSVLQTVTENWRERH
jgi:hypothetical protein